ncbi:MAG TPA: hypothetical protein VF595_14475 [Tepidisphaeraceae bacterium]|jgi:hypothetical protein
MIENLEPRTMCTSTVRVTTTDNVIRIVGNRNTNDLSVGDIESGISNSFLLSIESRNRSTRFEVDGVLQRRRSLLLNSTGKALEVSLVGGQDTLVVGQLSNVTALRIDLGSGDDATDFSEELPTTALTTGDGDDLATFQGGTTTRGNLSVLANSGNDSIRFQSQDVFGVETGVNIGGKLQVVKTSGVLELYSKGLRVINTVAISTAAGDDRIKLIDAIFRRSTSVISGDGRDTIDFSASTFRQTPMLDVDPDYDTVYYMRQ